MKKYELISPPDFVPPSVAASVFGISNQAVFKRIRSGSLRTYSFFGRKFVSITELGLALTIRSPLSRYDVAERYLKARKKVRRRIGK